MKILLLLPLAFALLRSCQVTDRSEVPAVLAFEETGLRAEDAPPPEKVSIRGGAYAYSARFLEALRQDTSRSHVLLDEDLLVVDHRDTLFFPELPFLGKSQTIRGGREDVDIQLRLVRVTYSSLAYEIRFSGGDRAPFEQSGTLELDPGFTGDGPYLFAQNGPGKCRFHLWLEAPLRARMSKTCNGIYPPISPGQPLWLD